MAEVKRPKVLIVDDEDYIREMVKVKLEASGFDVVEAEDGKIGVEIAKKEKPDIILLDMVMPNMDGMAALSVLTRSPETKNAKIFLFTGQGLCRPDLNEMCQKFAIDEGAVDYLRKETDLSRIVETMNKSLRV